MDEPMNQIMHSQIQSCGDVFEGLNFPAFHEALSENQPCTEHAIWGSPFCTINAVSKK